MSEEMINYIKRIGFFIGVVSRPVTCDAGDSWWEAWRKYRLTTRAAWEISGILYESPRLIRRRKIWISAFLKKLEVKGYDRCEAVSLCHREYGFGAKKLNFDASPACEVDRLIMKLRSERKKPT
jgi:hypothetical protein